VRRCVWSRNLVNEEALAHGDCCAKKKKVFGYCLSFLFFSSLWNQRAKRSWCKNNFIFLYPSQFNKISCSFCHSPPTCVNLSLQIFKRMRISSYEHMRHAQPQSHVTYVAVIKGCQQGRKDGVVQWVAKCVTNCTTVTQGTKIVATLNNVGKVSKVKFPQKRSRRPRGGKEVQLYFSFTSTLEGGGGQRHGQAALPPRKTRYPLYRRLGGPQGRSGRVRKISSPPGFVCRTIQSIASHYTDCAITGHKVLIF